MTYIPIVLPRKAGEFDTDFVLRNEAAAVYFLTHYTDSVNTIMRAPQEPEKLDLLTNPDTPLTVGMRVKFVDRPCELVSIPTRVRKRGDTFIITCLDNDDEAMILDHVEDCHWYIGWTVGEANRYGIDVFA